MKPLHADARSHGEDPTRGDLAAMVQPVAQLGPYLARHPLAKP